MFGDCRCGHGYRPLWGAYGPPARIPLRSLHQPAHSFRFDAFALCLDSGRRHAHVHPLSLIRVSGRPESRNFKDNNPVIVSLLTGGGGRDVDRNGGPRHAHQTTHRWWGGVLVSLDIAQWGGGGEDSRVWLRCDMLHATFSSDGSLRASHLGCDVVGTLTENVASPW